MPKKPSITQEDLDTFYKAMEGIKPLTQKKVRLSPRSTTLSQKTHLKRNKEPLHFSEALDLDPIRGEDFIVYKQPGVSNKILRKLRKGQYNVEACLDLHGMSIAEAITAVDYFLQQCLHKGIRVVLVIHGKGHHDQQMPVLKNKLNHWLRELNIVLAFCSAMPMHGSCGAMYVLLKRTRGEEFF